MQKTKYDFQITRRKDTEMSVEITITILDTGYTLRAYAGTVNRAYSDKDFNLLLSQLQLIRDYERGVKSEK